MIGVVVDGSVRADPEPLCRTDGVDVRADKEEFPAFFLLLFDHLLHLIGGILLAGVFQPVGRDDEQRVCGDVFFSLVAVDILHMLHGHADRVDQCGTSAHRVIGIGQRGNVLQSQTVVQGQDLVVEQHGRHITFPRLFLLLFEHRVEPADRVLLQPRHRTGAVEDEHQLGGIVGFDGCLYFHVFRMDLLDFHV